MTPANARTQEDRIANNLLAALRPSDYELLRPLLEKREQATGETLFQPGDVIHFAYFPCESALVSYQVVMPDQKLVETALVGREGAVGGIVSNGRLPAFSRATIRNGGVFYRVALRDLERAKDRSPSLRNLFARYADCLMAQIYQATACNAAHPIEARSAKWMLASIDRTGSNTLALTQEEMATALGVGRSYVSRVLQKLKGQGAIALKRGRIVVQDRATLEGLACACDDLVRAHFETVLAGVYPCGGEEAAERSEADPTPA